MPRARVELTLFIDGASERSARAIADARRLCAAHLQVDHTLTVTDIRENPGAGAAAAMVAAPMLVRDRPLPVRRIVGDLSQADRVLAALDLP